MQNHVKFAIAIPVFVAVLMGAISVSQQQAQAQHSDHTTATSTATSSYSGHTGSGKTVMVHITNGDVTDRHQFHSAMMGVDHASAFLASGKDVVIVLDVDGVRIAAEKPTAGLESINDTLKSFLNDGGRVIACNHCVTMAGMTADDLLPGVEIDSHPFMPRMQKVIDDGAVVLDY
jgi:predicted peroxiredoxin